MLTYSHRNRAEGGVRRTCKRKEGLESKGLFRVPNSRSKVNFSWRALGFKCWPWLQKSRLQSALLFPQAPADIHQSFTQKILAPVVPEAICVLAAEAYTPDPVVRRSL